MKLLMVTRESQADKRYGLNKSLAPIIAELQHRGIEVGYLCQIDAGVNSINWIRRLHTPITRWLGPLFTQTEFTALLWGLLERLNMGRLAAKVMVREQYTHVHCHDPIIAAGYRWFARWRWFLSLRRGHTARWGLTEHGFGCYTQAFHEDGARLGPKVMAWLRRWERKIVLKAHWVHIPTQTGLGQLCRDLGYYPPPLTWYAIHHPLPQLNQYTQSQARQHLGWRADTLYIIAVGRLVTLKQFPNLIRACAQLSAQHWQLVILGDGDSQPLYTLAQTLKIAEQLTVTTSDDMGLYYAAADIYVSTSTTESFGLANLEALSMGLAAICTAVGGVAEVVGSGAQLIPADDERALHHALHTLVTDSYQRYHWQSQAQQWLQSIPSVATITEAYLALYQGKPLVKTTTTTKQSSLMNFATWQQRVNHWQICPLPLPLTLPFQATILFIAPHPDDEVLACGGTLALLRQRNCQIKVVMMTDGGRGDPLGYLDDGEDVVSCRQRQTRAALNVLGIDDVLFLTAPDSHYQHNAALSAQLSELFNNYTADWLLLPAPLDYHRDHVAISLSLLEIWQQCGQRQRVFCYETWTPLPATWVIDISSVFYLKQQAVQCHQLPLKYCDYLTACQGMAHYRSLYLPQSQQAEVLLELDAAHWPALLTSLYSIREYQEHFLLKRSHGAFHER